jgi:hypothetical protein
MDLRASAQLEKRVFLQSERPTPVATLNLVAAYFLTRSLYKAI